MVGYFVVEVANCRTGVADENSEAGAAVILDWEVGAVVK